MPSVIQGTQQILGVLCKLFHWEQVSIMSCIHSVAAERMPPRHMPRDNRVNGRQTTSESGSCSHSASSLSNDHLRYLLQQRDADQHMLASGNGVLALDFCSWRVVSYDLRAGSWRIPSSRWQVLTLPIILPFTRLSWIQATHLHLFIISHSSPFQFLCNSHTYLLLDSPQSISYFMFWLWMGT